MAKKTVLERVAARGWLGRWNSSRWVVLATLPATLFSLWRLVPLANAENYNTGHDFLLLDAASVILRNHQSPYDPRTFLIEAMKLGLPQSVLLYHGVLSQPYVYPPLFAWVLIPLSYFSAHTALLVWRVLSLGCVFAGTLGLLSGWAKDRSGGKGLFADRTTRSLMAALVTLSPLTMYVIYWGNPVVLSYAAMGGWTWALNRNDRQGDTLAGVLMLGALLKPQLTVPLALAAVWCLTRGSDIWSRRKRIALAFAATSACALGVDILVTGPGMLVAWVRSVRFLSGMIFIQPDMPSLIGLARPAFLQTSSTIQQGTLYTVMALGGLVAIGLYRLLQHRWSPVALLGLLTLVWCFATPYAHGNDMLLMVAGALPLAALIPVLLAGLKKHLQVPSLHGWLIQAGQGGVALLGLVSLWRGGVIAFDIGQARGILSSFVLAPLFLLDGYVACGTLFTEQPAPSHSQ